MRRAPNRTMLSKNAICWPIFYKDRQVEERVQDFSIIKLDTRFGSYVNPAAFEKMPVLSDNLSLSLFPFRLLLSLFVLYYGFMGAIF